MLGADADEFVAGHRNGKKPVKPLSRFSQFSVVGIATCLSLWGSPAAAQFSFTGLGDLVGGSFRSSAHGISADGSTIVGYGTSASGTEAFRLTSGGMVGLGDLPGGFYSEATGVSANGSVVVGFGDSASGTEAFRWTSSGMVGLGDLPGGFYSQARGVSADGSVVVGYSISGSGTKAFLWTQAGGMVNLKDFLITNGVGGLTNWTLGVASGISSDGLTIVGTGVNPSGFTEAWRATLFSSSAPEPGTLALLALGMVGGIVARRRK